MYPDIQGLRKFTSYVSFLNYFTPTNGEKNWKDVMWDPGNSGCAVG